MALVSLKRPKAEDEDKDAYESNPYGWGTSIHLNKDQVKALGLEGLAAGEKVGVKAAAFVSSASAEADATGEAKELSYCLQLTDMEVMRPAGSGEAANKLFGE